jgi:hypothetical protein
MTEAVEQTNTLAAFFQNSGEMASLPENVMNNANEVLGSWQKKLLKKINDGAVTSLQDLDDDEQLKIRTAVSLATKMADKNTVARNTKYFFYKARNEILEEEKKHAMRHVCGKCTNGSVKMPQVETFEPITTGSGSAVPAIVGTSRALAAIAPTQDDRIIDVEPEKGPGFFKRASRFFSSLTMPRFAAHAMSSVLTGAAVAGVSALLVLSALHGQTDRTQDVAMDNGSVAVEDVATADANAGADLLNGIVNALSNVNTENLDVAATPTIADNDTLYELPSGFVTADAEPVMTPADDFTVGQFAGTTSDDLAEALGLDEAHIVSGFQPNVVETLSFTSDAPVELASFGFSPAPQDFNYGFVLPSTDVELEAEEPVVEIAAADGVAEAPASIGNEFVEPATNGALSVDMFAQVGELEVASLSPDAFSAVEPMTDGVMADGAISEDMFAQVTALDTGELSAENFEGVEEIASIDMEPVSEEIAVAAVTPETVVEAPVVEVQPEVSVAETPMTFETAQSTLVELFEAAGVDVPSNVERQLNLIDAAETNNFNGWRLQEAAVAAMQSGALNGQDAHNGITGIFQWMADSDFGSSSERAAKDLQANEWMAAQFNVELVEADSGSAVASSPRPMPRPTQG